MTYYTIAITLHNNNPHEFLCGTLTTQTGKTHYYTTAKDLWIAISTHCERHRQQRRTALFYSLNMYQDYLTIMPTDTTRHHIYSKRPFICDITDENGRIYAKFLSTERLFKGTYEELCTLLTTQAQPLDFIPPYTAHKSQIVMTYLTQLRKRLTAHGIKPRWLITAGQIGMGSITKYLLAHSNPLLWFSNSIRREYHQTQHPKKVLQALKGGRCEIYHNGTYQHCTQLDINSHYSNVLAHMPLPDLSTERYHYEPETDILLHPLGISEVTIQIGDHSYGVLPVRVEDTLYFPNTPGQLLIGAWTHAELRAALQRGYVVKHIHWTLTWDIQRNILHDYIHDIYDQRQAATTALDKHFYKMLLNHTIGKFAQRSQHADYLWSSLDNHAYYLKNGYSVIDSNGRDNLYYKHHGELPKKHFIPIITTLVNSNARVQLLQLMERFHPDDLHYVDTDGIVVTKEAVKNETFKYSTTLGGLKKVHDDVSYTGYAPKTYIIGTDAKLAGIPRTAVTKEGITTQHITYDIMVTQSTARHPSEIGTYQQRERHLTSRSPYRNTLPILVDDTTNPGPHYEAIE